LEAALAKVVGSANIDISTADAERVLSAMSYPRPGCSAQPGLCAPEPGTTWWAKVMFPDRLAAQSSGLFAGKDLRQPVHDLEKAFNKAQTHS